MLGNSIRGSDPDSRRLLYITCVLPILTYGFQLWYRTGSRGCKKLVTKLKPVQSMAARWITGAFKTTPTGATETLAGLCPLYLNLERLYNKSSFRLHRLHDNHGIIAYYPLPAFYTSAIINIPNHPNHGPAPEIQRGNPRKRKALPPSSPLEALYIASQYIKETFFPFSPEATPGFRATDTHPTQIELPTLEPPEDKSDDAH
ncbi:hypothetical protein M378DRAFT_91757, partial [Amanita muscaria Koide BX008]